jgi:hypothetical protein
VDGRARGYSDDGRIAFRAMFTDNSSGLFYADFRSTADDLVVNSQGDAPDKDLDDGVCDTGNMVIGQGGAPTTECTLRAALAEANALPNVSRIAFAIHGEDGLRLPFPVIRLEGNLPDVAHPARIDATTQTGLDNGPSVGIDGAGRPGLVFRGVQGGESLVSGLAFNHHAGAALRIDGCREPIAVRDCRIGGSSNPAEIGSIEGFGIHVTNSSNITIGGRLEDANTIQGASLSGVYIEGDSSDNLVGENEIRSNRLNGVRVAGSASQRNKISKNSIHENGEEGIFLADGANDEIAAPVIDRSYYQGKTVLTGRTTVGEGTVEVFVDPVVVGAEPWFWGQGFWFIFTLTADPLGNFVIDLGRIQERGIVTATVTDSLGNTSEFSPIFSATLTQTVPTDPPLLVVKKPLAIRLHGDTGVNSIDTENVSLRIDVREGIRVRSEEKTLELSGFTAYFLREADRRRGLNTPLVILEDPLRGDLEVLFELRREGILRGRGKLGPFPVQETAPPGIGLVQVSILGPDGQPTLLPQRSNLLEAANYVAAVYPVDPEQFLRSLALLPPIRFDGQPTGASERNRLLRVLDGMRRVYVSRGMRLTHILGFVKEDADLGAVEGFASPYSVGIPAGVLKERGTYGGSTVLPLSIHGGPTMAHELGHQVPFLLGDEYEGGLSREANPVPVDAMEGDRYGIFILEEHLAFNPTGISLGPSQTLPDFPSQGPLWTSTSQPAGDFRQTVRSFMGNTAFTWISPRCHEHIFQALGGSIPGEGGGRGGGGAPAGPVPAASLIARGVVTAAGEGLLLPPSRSGRPSEPPPQAPGAPIYLLELQDAGGAVLASQAFPVTFVTEVFGTGEDGSEAGPTLVPTEAAPFSVLLDDSPAAARLVLKRGGTVLATRQRSPNPPAVTLLAPHGPGDLAAGTVEVRWQAADPDPGDETALVATVLYTPDGGATVLPVAVELEGASSLTAGLDELPGGATGRFIVRVTDGWHEAEDASDPALSLPDRTPAAFVQVPWGDEGPPVGETVSILGLAHDPEDGVLTGAALEWRVDGAEMSQGTGVVFRAAFAEGEHTVLLTATDSTGKSATAEARIVAGGCAPGECAPRFLRSDCNGDGRLVGVTDAIFLLNYSFVGTATPPCLAACDVNADGGAAQITDALYILNFSFLGGPAPRPPFPACGAGNVTTDATIGCDLPLADCP